MNEQDARVASGYEQLDAAGMNIGSERMRGLFAKTQTFMCRFQIWLRYWRKWKVHETPSWVLLTL